VKVDADFQQKGTKTVVSKQGGKKKRLYPQDEVSY
jgi:hypothetical protein